MIVGLADAPGAWPMIEEIFFISGACIDASGGGFVIGRR